MSVTVDDYTTSKFILKDDAAVAYIQRLVDLLQDESALSSGYLSSDAYIDLIDYGDRAFKFVGRGFMDSGPELRYSAVNKVEEESEEGDEDEDYEDDYDPIYLFSEIQANLAEGGWFFVENHASEKSYFSSRISLYHQNGKAEYSDSYEIKKEMLKKLGISGKIE